ncbi:unnamed protein product [Colias eurytheme]|nr:unnamed protein product [Colias eurytheme]
MLTVLVWGLVAAAARARELDPAACAARFDVQRDKIIRTEESREMGARYLSELDVGSRRECLRLCCETEGCDVFVFEEKSPGSCYLFKCGPPEDFRCKFTAHGNFSSGVLALSRRLAELQDQERLAPPDPPDLGRQTTTSTVRPSAPARPPEPPRQPPRQPPPHQSLQTAPLPTGRCSRYQFECRVGGECIAVYNACDGIAQCADGSDEAPELGCPQAPAAPLRPAAPAPPAPPAPSAPLAPAPPRPTLPPPPPTTRPPPVIPQLHVASEMEESGGMSAAEAVAEAAELWPHRLTQAQPQHRYNSAMPNVGMSGAGSAGAPHIFSHKGGLVQELADGYEPAPDGGWPHRAWQTPQHHAGLSMGMGSDRVNLGSNLGMEGAEAEWGGAGYGRADWPERAWPPHRLPPPPPPQQMQEQEMYGNTLGNGNMLSAERVPNGLSAVAAGKTMPELPLVYSGQQQALRDAPKKGFELAERMPTLPPPPRAPQLPLRSNEIPTLVENATKKKVLKENDIHEQQIVKTSPVASGGETASAKGSEPHVAVGQAGGTVSGPGPVGVAGGPNPAAREQWADEHDGLSEHPPAALLLLILGTLMTAALGALAGCRLRAASRRRRHHPRYALDADYLVNGMYL